LSAKARKNNRNPNLATIDHMTPICHGIDKLDESNWAVSCKRCNKNKGSLPYDEFIKRLPYLLTTAAFVNSDGTLRMNRWKKKREKKKLQTFLEKISLLNLFWLYLYI
jgi:5-methylcytosine-specific restriction endonuclease McrA